MNTANGNPQDLGWVQAYGGHPTRLRRIYGGWSWATYVDNTTPYYPNWDKFTGTDIRVGCQWASMTCR